MQSVEYPSAAVCTLSKASGHFMCIPISRLRFKLWLGVPFSTLVKKFRLPNLFLLQLFSKIVKIFLIFLLLICVFFNLQNGECDTCIPQGGVVRINIHTL